jgi:hypothetical protein
MRFEPFLKIKKEKNGYATGAFQMSSWAILNLLLPSKFQT